jgi:hypothetical protein
MSRLLLLAIIATAFFPGCLARQVARDGKDFRQAVLDIYTDQVMDNLIRAREGLPFEQLAYRDLLIQDTDSLGGTLYNPYLDETTKAATGLGVLSSVTEKFSNTLRIGVSAKRDRVMSFKADPITDKNDIYELYLAYAMDPELFVVSCQPPPCHAVHIMRQWNDKFYWVPIDAAPVFQRLVLETTFMRGAKTTPSAYYERTIVDVLEKEVAGQDERAYLFQFATPLPNGEGAIEVDARGGRTSRLPLRPLLAPARDFITGKGVVIEEIPATGLGGQTDLLLSNWNPKEQNFKKEDLVGRMARVYLTDFPPPAPKTSPELQRILDNLDQIRANVVRPLTP